MELVAVVMGAKTSAARNAACKELLDYGFANFAVIAPELTEIPGVNVKLGKQGSVSAALGESTGLLIDKAQKSAVTTEVALEESVTAPVAQGQRIGTLSIKSGEQTLRQIPLVASEPVERLTMGDIFVNVLRRAAMAK